MKEMEMKDDLNNEVASTMDGDGIIDESLQMGSMVDKDIYCAGCNQVVSTSNAYCYVDKNGDDLYYCEECKKNIDQAIENETKNPNVLGAILFGLLAGVVTGAIWCAITFYTHYTIGYVAIAVGFLIGCGVLIGSGKKRVFTLQIISALITLITILCASYMTEILFIHDALKTEYGINQFLWISPFDPDLLKDIISPIGIFIWAIGISAAYKVPGPKKM